MPGGGLNQLPDVPYRSGAPASPPISPAAVAQHLGDAGERVGARKEVSGEGAAGWQSGRCWQVHEHLKEWVGQDGGRFEREHWNNPVRSTHMHVCMRCQQPARPAQALRMPGRAKTQPCRPHHPPCRRCGAGVLRRVAQI